MNQRVELLFGYKLYDEVERIRVHEALAQRKKEFDRRVATLESASITQIAEAGRATNCSSAPTAAGYWRSRVLESPSQ